jgi:hypothetical protein
MTKIPEKNYRRIVDNQSLDQLHPKGHIKALFIAKLKLKFFPPIRAETDS